MTDVPFVSLPALMGGQRDSWSALIELSPGLGENWTLAGGQLVFLHQIERQASDVRPTDDVDVVVDIRAEPSGLRRVHQVLIEAGFAQDMPGPEGTAHRYRRDAATLDILAPDNVGARARLMLGAGRTVQAPGTTQALRRTETVTVEIDGQTGMIRRPNLIGAVVGKAAAVIKIPSQSAAARAKHLTDVDSLAKLIGVADREHSDLSRSERGLLARLGDAIELSELARTSLHRLAADET
ncbi:MAG: hypothetical protein GY708_28930 [Actinomycetia bacterium]|nr:hypothetical protein [Actinomycetes bacterium]